MRRLFTALEVPDLVGQQLALLRGGLPGARWIEPESYHVTLSFIGDIEDGLARDLAEGLDGLKRDRVPVRLTGLDAFGGRRPHSLHAVVAPDPRLLELQAVGDRLLRRLGAPVEARAYTPHLTLARLRAEAGPRAVADWLGGHGPLDLAYEASRFVLMSSKPSTGGGPYGVEAWYPLGEDR